MYFKIVEINLNYGQIMTLLNDDETFSGKMIVYYNDDILTVVDKFLIFIIKLDKCSRKSVIFRFVSL